MGKLEAFTISFEEDRTIYHAGDTVAGCIEIKLTAAMEIKALKVLFCGKAHVSWDEGSDDQKGSYSATQILFAKEIFVHGNGSPDSNERCELSAGDHKFRFSFPLPSPLPSSYEDSVGFVRYYVKSTLFKPWKFDHNTKKVFTVLDVLDLNQIENALRTVGASVCKKLCCFRCQSGPIELEFYLDRSGYVPGEWISVNASITNSSNRKLPKTSADFFRSVTYRAQSGEKTDWKLITKLHGAGCPAKSTLNWTDQKMQIPPLPPTELQHCSIIDIEYLVQFTVHTPICSQSLKGQAPIIIGTVPIRNLPQYENLSSTVLSDMPVQLSTPPPSFSTLPENDLDVEYNNFAPPPSYAAAMEGSTNVRDHDDNEFTMGEMSYTPHYTYYDWNRIGTTSHSL